MLDAHTHGEFVAGVCADGGGSIHGDRSARSDGEAIFRGRVTGGCGHAGRIFAQRLQRARLCSQIRSGLLRATQSEEISALDHEREQQYHDRQQHRGPQRQHPALTRGGADHCMPRTIWMAARIDGPAITTIMAGKRHSSSGNSSLVDSFEPSSSAFSRRRVRNSLE